MDFPKNKRRWNWRKFHNNGEERSTKYNSYLWSLNVAKQAFRRRILMISISFEMLLFMWWIWKRSSVCFVANFIVDCEVFHYSHYSSFSPLCFWRKSLTCWVFEISFASRLLWNQEDINCQTEIHHWNISSDFDSGYLWFSKESKCIMSGAYCVKS